MGYFSVPFNSRFLNKQDSKVSASFFLLTNSKSEDSIGHLKCKVTCRSFHVNMQVLNPHAIEELKESLFLTI